MKGHAACTLVQDLWWRKLQDQDTSGQTMHADTRKLIQECNDCQVMAALVISISSDLSEESVPIVPAYPLVALEVGAVSVISHTGMLDLVDYSSSSDSDLSEDFLSLIPELPLVSPFLCFDDSDADNESEPAE
ncbi:hypothetical protein Tco_1036987 [Tanacetum coccineum]